MDEKRPSLDEATERVREDVDELRAAAFERGHLWREKFGAFVDEHPYAAVGIAFGAGYLLSGALLSRATWKAVVFGGRLLFGGVVKQAIVGGALSLVAPLLHGMTNEVSTEK